MFISVLTISSLRLRLSDFQVNEIELDGTIVRLTSRTVPEKEDEICPIEGIYITLTYMIFYS